MDRMSELKAWEARCKFEFTAAQQDHQRVVVENALFDLLSRDERSGYKLGQQVWTDFYNRYGYAEVMEAGERLVYKGRCGFNDGGLYTN